MKRDDIANVIDRLRHYIDEESSNNVNPDNARLATMADALRLAREYAESGGYELANFRTELAAAREWNAKCGNAKDTELAQLRKRVAELEGEAKSYRLRAHKDGLWVELNGQRYKGMIRLDETEKTIIGKAVLEVWNALAALDAGKGE